MEGKNIPGPTGSTPVKNMLAAGPGRARLPQEIEIAGLGKLRLPASALGKKHRRKKGPTGRRKKLGYGGGGLNEIPKPSPSVLLTGTVQGKRGLNKFVSSPVNRKDLLKSNNTEIGKTRPPAIFLPAKGPKCSEKPRAPFSNQRPNRAVAISLDSPSPLVQEALKMSIWCPG